MDITKKIDKYLNESNKIDKNTLYVDWSSTFDNPSNKYDVKLFMKTLKKAGAKEVWTDNKFGWSNQPEVVLFKGLDKDSAQEVLGQLPVFKRQGVLISNAYYHWD